MGRVDNKVALITGAAMGIGRACAERLAQEGASVIISDFVADVGQETADRINAAGGKATFIHHDVTQESQWISVTEEIKSQFGGLDILVNNAGIAIMKSVLEMTMDEFHQQNAVNLDGVFLGLKYCIPVMADSGGGSIINLSSVAGLKASPGLAAYAMTKGGVRLLSKSVAKECTNAGNGVRVNSVHPGIIETAIWDKMGLASEGQNRSEITEVIAKSVPGEVVGQPIDIANGVLFLASDEANYITGSELVIDHALSA